MSQLFQKMQILVAGDLMLDVYAYGKVKRISPEAPVPVMNLEHTTTLPGGAGNTLVNLIALGMDVIAMGRVGEDKPGADLLENLVNAGVNTKGVVIDPLHTTPEKTRFIAHSQQLLRIDHENVSPLSFELEQMLIDQIPALMSSCDLVAISDYAKGFLTPRLLRALIDVSNAKGIPVIVDPKGLDFSRYSGATMLKPNLHEAKQAAALYEQATLEEIASVLLEKSGVKSLTITRSEHGISLFERTGERYDVPAKSLHVTDVTGAGDTVLAILAAALSNGYSSKEAVSLANLGASIAVQHVGCTRVSAQDLHELLMSVEAMSSTHSK